MHKEFLTESHKERGINYINFSNMEKYLLTFSLNVLEKLCIFKPNYRNLIKKISFMTFFSLFSTNYSHSYTYNIVSIRHAIGGL